MSLVPLRFFEFDSSDSVVLQFLQTKPSVLFWSSQVRKEVQMLRRQFELLHRDATKFEIVRQKLR